jgi:hypothetical protein
MKTFIVLAAGLVGGYYYGFHDGHKYDQPVVNRIVHRAVARTGGSNRESFKTDVDAQMERVER